MSQLAIKRVLHDDALWGKILRYALSAEFLDVRPRFLLKRDFGVAARQADTCWLVQYQC